MWQGSSDTGEGSVMTSAYRIWKGYTGGFENKETGAMEKEGSSRNWEGQGD